MPFVIRTVLSIIIVLLGAPALNVMAQLESVPDTLDKKRYYPLHVGNEWHSVSYWPAIPTYNRVKIVGDTLVHGRRYFKSVSEYIEWNVVSVNTTWLRYNEADAVLLFKSVEDDTLGVDLTTPWYHADFRDSLDYDFSTIRVYVDGAYDTTVTFPGPLPISVGAVKRLHVPDPLQGTSYYIEQEYALDLGLVRWNYFDGASGSLWYAKIDGVEYGTPLSLVNNEEELLAPASSGIVALYPNPTRDQITLEYETRRGDSMVFFCFDLMGREVFTEHIPIINDDVQRIQFDVSNLIPGHYLLQMNSKFGQIDRAVFTVIP